MDNQAQVKTFHDAKGNTIKVEALIPVYGKQEEGYWAFYSPHLKTIGYSNESEEKAYADFEKGLKVFFDIHTKRGTLEKALIKFGWTKAENTLHKPKLGNTLADKFSKDFNLLAMAA